MKRIGIVKGSVVVLLLAGMVTAQNAAAETVLKVGGSGGPLGAARHLAKAYMKTHKGVTIKVLPSLGSSGGIKAVLGGDLDVAVTGRPLKSEEKAKGAVEKSYARSPYVFVTNKKVAKKAVTMREVEAYYSGKVRKWPDGSLVRLVVRPESESDTKLLRSLSPAMDQAVKAAIARAGSNFAVTDQDSIDMVIKIPGSFGGATLTQVLAEKLPVNVLALDGVKPSANGGVRKRYPIWKEFFVVNSQTASAAAKDFAAFFSSPQAKKILATYGNTPL
ncbi:substrate-binding domain-containing protein [Geotalea sp. SG265]|uniref:PstS family phosphate ABC transporter substrate-binding protein n=1 Tax=Geotalea sp. SG265 TaxID=2922867 RepID=UPI001FAF3870|nr:substrate-binding domain-containing protein [Geotalea sp. SG265]